MMMMSHVNITAAAMAANTLVKMNESV